MRACKVFVVFPSANPIRATETTMKWRQMGYQVGVYFDTGTVADTGAYREWRGPYEGYWATCNWMAHMLVNGQEQAQVVIFAADDIEPDSKHTCAEIADAYLDKFPSLYGVMQPTGDKQGVDKTGTQASARICGSPWIGANWVKRAYGGNGASWAEYKSFYGDEELLHVAKREGVLWLNPDIKQHHAHWSFGWSQQQFYQRRNSERYWLTDKALFEKRLAEGFPGSEPLSE